MSSLFLLIPLAIIFVALAIRLLFWAVKSGQYDDLDTEGRRILFDDDDHPRAPPSAHKPSAPKEQPCKK